MKILKANRIARDGTSHLGLCCLPMSHKGRRQALNELNRKLVWIYINTNKFALDGFEGMDSSAVDELILMNSKTTTQNCVPAHTSQIFSFWRFRYNYANNVQVDKTLIKSKVWAQLFKSNDIVS